MAGLWRFPVKSILGEELEKVEVTEWGLVGDRAFRLVDVGTGRVASAKNPKSWPDLFGFERRFSSRPAQPARCHRFGSRCRMARP